VMSGTGPSRGRVLLNILGIIVPSRATRVITAVTEAVDMVYNECMKRSRELAVERHADGQPWKLMADGQHSHMMTSGEKLTHAPQATVTIMTADKLIIAQAFVHHSQIDEIHNKYTAARNTQFSKIRSNRAVASSLATVGIRPQSAS